MNKKEQKMFFRFLKNNDVYEEFFDLMRKARVNGASPYYYANHIEQVNVCLAISRAFQWSEAKWHYLNTAWLLHYCNRPYSDTSSFNFKPYSDSEILAEDKVCIYNKERKKEYLP